MLDNDPGKGLTWEIANGATAEGALPSWKWIGATAHPWLRVYYERLSFWTSGIIVGHHLTSSELPREGWTGLIYQWTRKLYSGTGKRWQSLFSDKSLKWFQADPFEQMVTKEGNGVQFHWVWPPCPPPAKWCVQAILPDDFNLGGARLATKKYLILGSAVH
jgi:hypothetical protein